MGADQVVRDCRWTGGSWLTESQAGTQLALIPEAGSCCRVRRRRWCHLRPVMQCSRK